MILDRERRTVYNVILCKKTDQNDTIGVQLLDRNDPDPSGVLGMNYIP